MFEREESGRWRTEDITSSSFLIGEVRVSLAYVAAVCRPFMLWPPSTCLSYSSTPALLAHDSIVALRPWDVNPGCLLAMSLSRIPLAHNVTSFADGYRLVSWPEASRHKSIGPESAEMSTPLVAGAVTKARPQLSPQRPYTGIKIMYGLPVTLDNLAHL